MKNEMVIKCEMEVVQACWQGEIEEEKASGSERGETARHCGNSGGTVEPLFHW